MAQTLITPWEVVRYSPVKKDFPVSYVCDQILNKEEKLFNQCFGMDFYNKMIADKVAYGNVPEYDGSMIYAIDAKVVLDGTVFISLVASNASSPVDDTAWAVAPKFANASYNDLWNRYLKRYLAYNIVYSSINYATHQAGSKGLMRYIGDDTGQATVSESALYNYKSQLWDDSIDTLDNMKRWVSDHIDLFDSLLINPCGSSCKSRRRTRIAFRR